MLYTLRNRLVLSHILPLLAVIPLVAVGLTYVLETQVLLPRLAQNLIGDARLLVEISRTEYQLWGNPLLIEVMLSRVRLDPAEKVMFLNPDGVLLYSSDQADHTDIGQQLNVSGLDLARAGEEVALTNYSGLRLHNVIIDALAPVASPDGPVVGVVRVTYHLASVYELFWQMRLLIFSVLAVGLLLGGLIGLLLALSINRPVQRVTAAIYDLAQGTRHTPLPETGPAELRDQARAVNFLVARLHSLEQARRQLLANLVHELGRPLGALRSAIHALSRGAAQDAQLLNDITVGMDEETTRLQHVLDDLAHLHDQELGTLELKRENLPLKEWLPHLLVTYELAANEKRLQWVVNLPDDLPVIFADPVRLAQSLGNLLDNAMKYSPPGQTLTITAGQQQGMAWIGVADTGPGIAIEEQTKIFEPFYRGQYGRRIKQGMGLGLSLARDLVEAHGGRITIESTQGQGSHFKVWLPLSEGQAIP